MGKKRCEKILNVVDSDRTKEKEHQDSRDVITRGLVRDLKHYYQQLEEIDMELEKMYHNMGCSLTTIPSISTTTAVKILAEKRTKVLRRY